MTGWSDPTHPLSRWRKTSFVYGGGSAASASDPFTPHGPASHDASPRTIPEPTESSPGPSRRSAEDSENRLVTKCSAKAARSETPKITQVVGCVNAAAMPNRNSADLAPHDVCPGS